MSGHCQTCGGALLWFGDDDGKLAIRCLMCGRGPSDQADDSLPLVSGMGARSGYQPTHGGYSPKLPRSVDAPVRGVNVFKARNRYRADA